MLGRLGRISAQSEQEYQDKMFELKEEAKVRIEAAAHAVVTTASTGSVLRGFIAGCKKSKEGFDNLEQKKAERSRNCTCGEE